jgi:hypothetical protein
MGGCAYGRSARAADANASGAMRHAADGDRAQ